MKHALFGMFVVLWLTLLAGPVPAQEKQEKKDAASSPSPERVLTNSDVLSLVKAGLSESTIILAIQHAVTSFDTSPETLIALKNQGVSAKILDAMLGVKTRDKTTSKDAPASNVGTVSGRVSGILNTGDMKPARLARVYLIYTSTPEQWAASKRPSPMTAGWTYNARLSEFTMKDSAFTTNGAVRSKEEECKWSLASHNLSLTAALEYASKNDPSQVLQTQTDEEGEFAFGEVAPPGVWYVVATGRVGMNNAIWVDTPTIEPGKHVSLKLISPEAACQDLQ